MFNTIEQNALQLFTTKCVLIQYLIFILDQTQPWIEIEMRIFIVKQCIWSGKTQYKDNDWYTLHKEMSDLE